MLGSQALRVLGCHFTQVFRKSCMLSSALSPQVCRCLSTSPNSVQLPQELDKLKDLDRLTLKQVYNDDRDCDLAQTQLTDETSQVEFEAIDKDNEVVYKFEFSSTAGSPKEYNIYMFATGEDKPTLVDMHLERSIKHHIFILRVHSPPGNLVGSVYELPGVSRISIVEDEKRKCVLQILSNGVFGWATSATILDGTGMRKLGRMYKMKGDSTRFANRNRMNMTVHFPKRLATPAKVMCVGTCILLMGRYYL